MWLSTPVEFLALRRVYETARGIKPPLTKVEQEQLAYNQRYLMEQQRKAHNKVIEERKKGPRKRACIASAEINAAAYLARKAAGIKDHD